MIQQNEPICLEPRGMVFRRILSDFTFVCLQGRDIMFTLLRYKINKKKKSILVYKIPIANQSSLPIFIESGCREIMCRYLFRMSPAQLNEKSIGVCVFPLDSTKIMLLEHCEKIYNFEKSKIYTIEQDEQSNKFLLFIIPSKEWLSNTVLFSIFLLLIRYEQYFYNLEYNNNATLSDICNIIFKENKICINSEFHSLGCLLGYQSSYKLVSKELFSRLLRMDFVLSNRKTLFDIPLLSFDETSDSVYMNKLGMDAFLDGQLYDKVATMRLVTSIEKYNNFYKSRYMEIQSNC